MAALDSIGSWVNSHLRACYEIGKCVLLIGLILIHGRFTFRVAAVVEVHILLLCDGVLVMWKWDSDPGQTAEMKVGRRKKRLLLNQTVVKSQWQ